MSSDRIDHAAEALISVRAAHCAETKGEAQLLMAQAGVHATLALVEQQRTANLIALMTNATRQVAEGTTTVEAYLELYSRIAPQVEEVLGLWV